MPPIQAVDGCERPEPAETEVEEAESEAAESEAASSASIKPHRKILRLPEVQELYPKSRTQIWRDVRDGKFPAPVSLGPNSIGWYEDEVQKKQASLPRAGKATQEF